MDILFPRFCVNCGKYGDSICANCFQTIEISYTRTCLYCGKISAGGKICAQCKAREKPAFCQAIWAGSYQDEALKSMIHGLKYQNILDLAEVLGEMLAQVVMESGISLDVVVVPVPLHWEKQKKREFNQAELIARYLSKRLGLHGGLALKRVRETESQVGLHREMRAQNVENAFRCDDQRIVEDRVVLLVDDVATTGSTLHECAKALKSAGAKKVIVAVVARG